MKKTFALSAMCIVTMLFTNKAMSQVVASGTTGACIWELTGTPGDYTLTISGSGAMENYDYGSSPWYYHNDITTLDLQQGVTTIGNYAFPECYGLISVTIPNSVMSIGDYAFAGCSDLISVTIPNSVTTIGGGAFAGCSGLTSVTIPNSVTTIGDAAFSGCSGLTSVTIPNSVTAIGNSVFGHCNGLTSINVDANNPDYSSVNGVLFNKLQDTLIQYPVGKIGDYTIPNSVTTIGNYAFYACIGLTSVTIPNSVTSIGYYAFYECIGLISVTIPNSVTPIGDYAFFACSGLTSVTIPDSVTSIGNWAFYSCSGLTSVIIGNSVTSIGIAAFENCSVLTSVTIGNSVTAIGDLAFGHCIGLTSVTIPNSVTFIENYTFYECSGLTSVTIPNSVISIGIFAFAYCHGLTSVTIPNSVTSIGGGAFAYCSGLTELHVKAYTPPTLGAYTFTGVSDTIPVYVCGTISAYQSAPDWNYFTNIIEDCSGIPIVGTGHTLSLPQIYPNSATDNINIILPENRHQALFTLYDMQGKALIRKNISNRDVLSVSGLAAGIYVYSVRTATMSYTGKVVKE